MALIRGGAFETCTATVAALFAAGFGSAVDAAVMVVDRSAPGSCKGSTTAQYASLCLNEMSNSSGPSTRPADVSQVWLSALPQKVTDLIFPCSCLKAWKKVR